MKKIKLLVTEERSDKFPTHLHSSEFWESLGRVVASFGYLEKTLVQAIFAFTGQRPISLSNTEEELIKIQEHWIKKIENVFTETMKPLISEFEKQLRIELKNKKKTLEGLEEFLERLRELSSFRDVFCHGSWRSPNEKGASKILFGRRSDSKLFNDEVDCAYLNQIQKATGEAICEVINIVQKMDCEFPGIDWDSLKRIDQSKPE